MFSILCMKFENQNVPQTDK